MKRQSWCCKFKQLVNCNIGSLEPVFFRCWTYFTFYLLGAGACAPIAPPSCLRACRKFLRGKPRLSSVSATGRNETPHVDVTLYNARLQLNRHIHYY